MIFVVGDKTAVRTAGSSCSRSWKSQSECSCTPYKQNTNGTKTCKVPWAIAADPDGDIGNINNYSYLRHEFEQAKQCKKNIIVVYNSLRRETGWLPSYMKEFEAKARPFWVKNIWGQKVGDYSYIKQELGYD